MILKNKLDTLIKRSVEEFEEDNNFHWKLLKASLEDKRRDTVQIEITKTVYIETLTYIYKKDGELIRVERNAN